MVGQLARRHGISVALRPSPYGGVTAVALIPQRLIVEDGPAAITAGGAPAAVMADAEAGMNSAPSGPYGSRAPQGATGQAGSYGPPGGYAGSGAGDGGNGGGYVANGGQFAGTGGGYPGTGGYADTTRGEYAGNGSVRGHAGNEGGYRLAAAMPVTRAGIPLAAGTAAAASTAEPAGTRETADSAKARRIPGRRSPGPAPTAPRVSAPVRPAAAPGSGEDSGTAPGARRGRHGASDVPVVTGVPVSRPTAPSFDVFTPLHRPGEDGAAPMADDVPGGESYGAADRAGRSRPRKTVTSVTVTRRSEDYKGLPRRVRQANLAPQLRSSAAAAASGGPGGVPRATAASLSDMRNTLSAMQRGWQQGRSQTQRDTEGSADGD